VRARALPWTAGRGQKEPAVLRDDSGNRGMGGPATYLASRPSSQWQRAASADRLPFEEAVDGDDAPPPNVCISERRQPRNRLGLGVDWPAAALRVAAPVRDQTPFQEIQGPLAGLRVPPDDEQLLARRGVVAARHVREPAVPHVEPVDDRQPQRTRCLNNSSARAGVVECAIFCHTLKSQKMKNPISI